MNPSECIKTDERCIPDVATATRPRSPVAEKLARWFIWSAALILLVTALGKITSAFGSARILEMQDPILGIKFRLLLPLVGGLELVIAALCCSKRFSTDTKLIFIAWMSIVFVIYRVGLWLLARHRPCGCMGSLAGVLHLTDRDADLVMKVALGYLLLGSCLGISGRAAFYAVFLRERIRGSSALAPFAFFLCASSVCARAESTAVELYKTFVYGQGCVRSIRFIQVRRQWLRRSCSPVMLPRWTFRFAAHCQGVRRETRKAHAPSSPASLDLGAGLSTVVRRPMPWSQESLY